MKEGWVDFQRIQCKEGFIDRWIGDMADNPNLTTKNQWCLSAFVTYYRLNGTGEWIENKIQMDTDKFTANEIWLQLT